MSRKGNLCALLMGMLCDVTTVKNSMEIVLIS